MDSADLNERLQEQAEQPDSLGNLPTQGNTQGLLSGFGAPFPVESRSVGTDTSPVHELFSHRASITRDACIGSCSALEDWDYHSEHGSVKDSATIRSFTAEDPSRLYKVQESYLIINRILICPRF